MKINIKKLDGTVYNLEVTLETKVPELKQLIEDASTIPISLQRVIYKGKVLRDDKDLQFYNIEDGVTLHLAERAPEPTNPPPSDSSTLSSSRPSTVLPTDEVINSVMRSFAPPTIPFDTQLRDAIANINNPEQTLVTGPIPPGRDGEPYNPQAQPSHERLSNYLELTLAEINQLVTRMNHLNEQLRNNDNITDPEQRIQLQAEATSVGLSLSRLSNATSLLSQCTNAFRTTAQTNNTHFVPSVSQITLNLVPNGLSPVTTTTTTTPADLLNLPTGSPMVPIPGAPGSFISIVPQAVNLRSRSSSNASQVPNLNSTPTSSSSSSSSSNSLNSVQSSPTRPRSNSNASSSSSSSTTTTTTAQQQQQQQQQQQNATTANNTTTGPLNPDELNNVISQTLNGLFTSLGQQPNNNPLGGILNSVLTNVTTANGQPTSNFSGIFSNISQMFAGNNNNNNNNASMRSRPPSPLSIIFNNMPQFLNGFQLIANGAEQPLRQGHRIIRQILVQDLLAGNSSPEIVDRMVESYSDNIRQQVIDTRLPDDLAAHVTNRNYPDIVASLARKYMKRFFSMFIAPLDSTTIHEEISSFSSDFVQDLIDRLSECFDNGNEGAFGLIDQFVKDKIVCGSPYLQQFSTMTSQYFHNIYQQNNNNRDGDNNINRNATTTTTTTNSTQSTNNNNNNNRTTTTTTTTTTSTSTPSGRDAIIPTEWRETIEIDQARQSSGTTRTPSSTYFKGKKTPKVKREKESDNSTSSSSSSSSSNPFSQVLQRSVEGTQIDSEELLKSEEANVLSQLYQNTFLKNNK